MTGDSEHDNDGADEFREHEPAGETQGAPEFRRFRAWASAYEPTESVFGRMRSRLASLFSRKQSMESDGRFEAEADVVTLESSPSADTLVEPRAMMPHESFDFDQQFESMDEALPAAESPEPRKRSLFSRLIRGEQSPDALAEELEVEVHEDRIDAAADALDEVGTEQFEPFDGEARVQPQAFESVAEALPSEPESPPESPPAVTRFAPPLAVEPLPALPPIFDEPVSADTALDGLPIVGEFAKPAFDGATTQDLEEKTDEFEIPELEGPTDQIDLEPSSTLEVQRKNIWASSFLARILRRDATQVEGVGADEEQSVAASAKFLLAKFRAFYNEIIRFRHQHSEFTAGFATAILADVSTNTEPDAAAESLSKRLGELLELQAAEAKWMGGEAAERYPDAQYAMAALADEVFTYNEWDGQASWPAYSLEHKLHHTRGAEVEVFRRIDKLLKDAPDTVVARDLARVYLLVLAAGFQGKWRPFELTRPLAEYRRRLYEYIYDNDPLMLYSSDRKVFPEAVSSTLEGHAVSRFTAAQRWAVILALLTVSYTVVAHVAWKRVSADLKDVTTRIKTGSTAGAP